MVLGRRRICLALSGGAARAVTHLGVLRALRREGIPIDGITATSGGALIAAFFAAGWEPDQMMELLPELSWRRLTRIGFSKMGLVSADPIEQMVIQHLGDIEFKDLKIPLGVACTDLMEGKQVVFTEGRLADKIKATCSFPGIFKPVQLNGKLLVDGGIFENVPIRAAHRILNADMVIAVDAIPQAVLSRTPRNLIDVVDRAVDLVLKTRARHLEGESDVYIEPLSSNFSSLALESAPIMIRLGDEAAMSLMPEIRKKARLMPPLEPASQQPMEVES